MRTVLLACCAVLLAISVSSGSVLVGTYNASGGTGVFGGPGAFVTVRYDPWPLGEPTLAETIDLSDLGSTIYFNGLADAGIVLTDGLVSPISHMIEGTANTASDSQYTFYAGAGPVDFQGFDIERIGFTVNEIFLQDMGNGNYSKFASLTFRVEAVPEPAAISMIALASLGMRRRR